MLSGEGNENGRKTTTGLISKKSNFARAAHFFCTFLCLCFARLQRGLPETSWLHVLWRKCCCRSFSPRWPLTILIFSPPLQNFMLFLQQKKVSFVFSLSLQLFCQFSFAGCRPTFSFSLSFSFSVFQMCGHDN